LFEQHYPKYALDNLNWRDLIRMFTISTAKKTAGMRNIKNTSIRGSIKICPLSLLAIPRLAPYRGWFPVICSLCCSNFVYFYCFHGLKASWLRGHKSAPGTDLVIGIAAGDQSYELATHHLQI